MNKTAVIPALSRNGEALDEDNLHGGKTKTNNTWRFRVSASLRPE